jgi:hypothetical protein
MGFVSILRHLLKDPAIGKLIVPIVPDEARTFGLESAIRQVAIYASEGQKYTPHDNDMLLYYREEQDGQILEEGITEAGSMASFTAAGTAYSNYRLPTIPFYMYYSMFGFQRVGDMIWAFADSRGKGFLMGGTAGRTTMLGEGLQHQDGHSHVLASTVPRKTSPSSTTSPCTTKTTPCRQCRKELAKALSAAFIASRPRLAARPQRSSSAAGPFSTKLSGRKGFSRKSMAYRQMSGALPATTNYVARRWA